VAQKKAQFIPHVLPVLVGTTVAWPNNDDIYHNVFSYSETRQFDLDLYKAPTIKEVTFDKPGRVDVFCSIHSTMNCVVLVLENPYYTATDPKGAYTIGNVPAGTYSLIAIVNFNGGGVAASLSVVVTITNLPPVVRITSPPNGAVFRAPVNVPIFAFAADRDRRLTMVPHEAALR